MKCKKCSANLDLAMAACPGCGAEVEFGRLTGILGLVCRACDAYNDPGAKTCIACGKPIGAAAEPTPSTSPSPPAPAGAGRGEGAQAPEPPAPPAPATPVVRSFPKPATGAATRYVPAASLKPSPASGAPGVRAFHPPAAPAKPAATPVPGGPAAAACPRCGAQATGRFCAQCGQALGAHGTQVMMKPAAAGRSASQVFGALAPGRAKLVLEEGGDYEGATFRLGSETVEAGRSKGAILFPTDPCLAPHHATFLYRNGALHVRDEGAPGGVYLRLRALSVPLRPGDHFAVGERLLRFAGLLPSAPTPPPDGTLRLGSPRPAGPAVVIEEWLEGGVGGRVFVRAGPAITIGRGGCAVNLGEDPKLSQLHAEIVVEQDGTARLRDVGSSNGTYVKVPPHGERELRDGDCVRMGREVLRVAVAE
jgi:pSer/pThr/pTyr-binding forkhead associated (FHA) protein